MKTKRFCIGRHSMAMVFLLLLMAALLPSHSLAGAINVLGTSDPWLAGMPDGSTASSDDMAPGQSPVLATGLTLAAGQALTFSVTGSVNNAPGNSGLTPDGGGYVEHATGIENGISNIVAPLNSLVGVFLNSNPPTSATPPAGINFQDYGINFTNLSPQLQQVFFIGDGLTGTGAVQTFIVPNGATRLYLGTMDGYGWYNNDGSFDVNVTATPVPAAVWLLGSGLLGLVGIRRKIGK